MPKVKKKKFNLEEVRRTADHLYQVKLISLKPFSIISGEPTEVIHHFIPKSRSNALRYDFENGIPLTNKEHCKHHTSGDPTIVGKIIECNGLAWFNDLQERRNQITKYNREYFEEILKKLE